MAVTLKTEQLNETLDSAILLATGPTRLPDQWTQRAERLATSPSVGFIAAVGAVLLAKATDPAIDAYVLKTREGSRGAYNLRSAATVLARNRHRYGYDIGSTSDRDPINHSTLNNATRWDIALERITPAHKPFFRVILGWLPDINAMNAQQATRALAAYLRARLQAAPGASVQLVPPTLTQPPPLHDLISALEAFSSDDTQGGALGMALVASAYRAAGFDADVPSRNDPRRIDIPIKRDGRLLIGSEVKQEPTREPVADTLVQDTAAAGARRGLLAVLRPGTLVDFDIAAVIRRAERDHAVVLRIADGVRELLHEAISASDVTVEEFCARLPRYYAETLREIRASDDAITAWAGIAQRWTA